MKTCSKCKALKPHTEFNRRSDKPHLWKSHCKSCICIKNKQYYSDNQSKILDQKHEYYAYNTETIKAQRREQRAAMSEEERQAHCEYLREWRSDNPDKVKAYRRSTRAKRKGAFVEHVPFEAIWNRDRGVCQLCDKNLDLDVKFPDWGAATLDHIKPLAKGGLHEMTNVQLACWHCNWLKRDHFQI